MSASGGLFRRLVATAIVTLAAHPAYATDTTVAPGSSLTLTDDVVLSDAESFVAGTQGGARCTIDGATHSLRTMPGWTGRIAIASCDASNLGTAAQAGIEVSGAAAGATFDVRDTVFETSGQIKVESFGDMTFAFQGNTIAANSVVPAVISQPESRPAFHFRGTAGDAQKKFQGNRILHSWVTIEGGHNWLIGGSTPAESNVIVGVRAGFEIIGTSIIVRGNYVHVTGMLAGWNQVSALLADGTDGSLLFEHNVLRGGNWLERGFHGGELRYNLLGDPYVVSWVLVSPDADARIHHNVLVRNNKLMEQVKVIGVGLVNASSGNPSVEFYNNTFDGSGYCYDVIGRAVSIDQVSFLASLRSNAFFNLPSDNGPDNTALVGPGNTSDFKAEMKGDPGPPRLGYADYNLFFNPNAVTADNYGISVAGLEERVSPGFALHDAPSGGAKDEQVDPRFTGPLPTVFPFADEDVISGALNVCQILAFYREIYTPRPDSPVVDMGDPADGVGNDIGAVGAGTDDAADLFGRGCAESDRVLAAAPSVVTTCMQPIVIGGSGTGGNGGGGHGFVCVCETGTGGPGAASLGVLAGLVFCAYERRASRRRR